MKWLKTMSLSAKYLDMGSGSPKRKVSRLALGYPRFVRPFACTVYSVLRTSLGSVP
ncbi:hypothetical protein [Nocardia sp. NPDC005998]|uniref:hypothetical protein n=1 Tax=Nocardia sp. NPDC005998 TaxID=3156894 RepID=UPI0033A5623D